jgi:methionine-rich copper-binding protein CopC
MTYLRRRAPVLFASFVLLATASGALAHATLESSDPAEGESVATPYVMVARYDEELSPVGSSIVVRDAGGNVVAQGGVAQDDSFTMIVELPLLAPGPYAAHWIAITADDNGKTQGDINFMVIAASPSAGPTATPITTVATSGAPATSPTPEASFSPTPSPAPTPTPVPTSPPPSGGQPTGGELIVPLVLAGAVIVALGWFLLRRRPT